MKNFVTILSLLLTVQLLGAGSCGETSPASTPKNAVAPQQQQVASQASGTADAASANTKFVYKADWTPEIVDYAFGAAGAASYALLPIFGGSRALSGAILGSVGAGVLYAAYKTDLPSLRLASSALSGFPVRVLTMAADFGRASCEKMYSATSGAVKATYNATLSYVVPSAVEGLANSAVASVKPYVKGAYHAVVAFVKPPIKKFDEKVYGRYFDRE